MLRLSNRSVPTEKKMTDVVRERHLHAQWSSLDERRKRAFARGAQCLLTEMLSRPERPAWLDAACSKVPERACAQIVGQRLCREFHCDVDMSALKDCLTGDPKVWKAWLLERRHADDCAALACELLSRSADVAMRLYLHARKAEDILDERALSSARGGLVWSTDAFSHAILMYALPFAVQGCAWDRPDLLRSFKRSCPLKACMRWASLEVRTATLPLINRTFAAQWRSCNAAPRRAGVALPLTRPLRASLLEDRTRWRQRASMDVSSRVAPRGAGCVDVAYIGRGRATADEREVQAFFRKVGGADGSFFRVPVLSTEARVGAFLSINHGPLVALDAQKLGRADCVTLYCAASCSITHVQVTLEECNPWRVYPGDQGLLASQVNASIVDGDMIWRPSGGATSHRAQGGAG